MMRLLFTILCLAQVTSNAQDTLTYIKINNGSVYYERVFDIPNKTKEEVDSLLHIFIAKLPSISQYSENKNGITARFEKAEIPLKKYGLKGFTSSYLIQSPFIANISIESKDGKYKVVVSGVFFETGMSVNGGGASFKIDGSFENIAYIKRKDRLVDSHNEQRFREAKAFEQYMSEMFDYSTSELTKSDW
jgi:hypothetical protein